jgi:hypothetical protein
VGDSRTRPSTGKAATSDLLLDNENDVLIIGHGAVGTLLLCDLLGTPIKRAEDQIGEDAAPGGGNFWTFDRSTATVLHWWRPVEATPQPHSAVAIAANSQLSALS